MIGTSSAERSERTPWYTMAFITVVFYLMEHDLFASVNVSLYGLTLAADKASAVAEGSLIRRVSYLAFGLYGIIAWLRVPRFRLNLRGILAGMMIAYLGWAVMSLAWSMDAMLTLRRLSALGLMALGITGLLRQYSGTDIVRLFLFMTLSYLVIGVGAELALGMFTPWAPGYRFAGTLHPNIQGVNCAVLIFAALTLAMSSERFRPVLLAAALGGFCFLILTGSRTALAGWVVAMVAVWALKTRQRRVLTVAIALSCVGLLGTFLVVNGLLPSPLGLLLKERAQGGGVLSGRTDLWAILIEYARERPILGYGYGAFFNVTRGLDIASRVGTWAFGGPHSDYLGTLLDVGAIGLASLLGVLFGGLWSSVRVYRQTLQPHYLLLTALLVFQIVAGLSDAEMLNPNLHFIPAAAIAFVVLRTRRFNIGEHWTVDERSGLRLYGASRNRL